MGYTPQCSVSRCNTRHTRAFSLFPQNCKLQGTGNSVHNEFLKSLVTLTNYLILYTLHNGHILDGLQYSFLKLVNYKHKTLQKEFSKSLVALTHYSILYTLHDGQCLDAAPDKQDLSRSFLTFVNLDEPHTQEIFEVFVFGLESF